MTAPTSAGRHPSSVLFDGHAVPVLLPPCLHIAGSERFIKKALSILPTYHGQCELTCDCEDGAAVGDLKSHATMIVETVRQVPEGMFGIGVRLPHFTAPDFLEVLRTVLGGLGDRLGYLTLPKVKSLREVRQTLALVRSLGGHRLPPLDVLIETPEALTAARRIARIEGVRSLEFGLLDFISSHYGVIPEDAMRSPAQFRHPLIVRAKAEIVAAAAASLKPATHNVTLHVEAPEQAREDAKAAREFGFQRMWSIHPTQIQPIIEGMRPTVEDMERASAVLLRAHQVDWGPIKYDGTLYDRASYRFLWTVLQRGHQCGAPVPPEAFAHFFSS